LLHHISVDTPSALPPIQAIRVTISPIAGPATHQGQGVTKIASYTLQISFSGRGRPGGDAAHKVHEVGASGLLQQAGRRRGALARPAVEDDGTVDGDLVQVLARARDLAGGEEVRVAFQLEIAALYENEIADDEAAVEGYRTAIGIDAVTVRPAVSAR